MARVSEPIRADTIRSVLISPRISSPAEHRTLSFESMIPPTLAVSHAASRAQIRKASCTRPTTGIWRTVWLEPVDKVSIRDLKLVPDVDGNQLRLTVNTTESSTDATVHVAVSYTHL